MPTPLRDPRLLALAAMMACLLSLHNVVLTSTTAASGEGRLGPARLLDRHAAIAAGAYPDPVLQSRPLIPLAAFALKRAGIDGAAGVFVIEFASAVIAAFGFLMFAAAYVRTKPALGFALLLFAMFTFAASKDVSRLGAALSIGLFLAAAADARGARWSFARIVLLTALCATRPELSWLICAAAALHALRDGRRGAAAAWAAAGAVMAAFYAGIVWYYGISDLSGYTLQTEPDGPLRIRQLTRPGAWLTIIVFLNILPVIAWMGRGLRDDRELFALTVLYSIALPLVGNVGEYRLWLPLAAILCARVATLVEAAPDRDPCLAAKAAS